MIITDEKDAEIIRNSIIEGKDEDIIDIITQRTYPQICKISNTFNKIYNKDLILELKKFFYDKGNIEDICIALVTNSIENDCNYLNKAIKSIPKDLEIITEILSTRPSLIIKQINEKYKELFKYEGKDLIKEIECSFSGFIKNILISLLTVKRSENNYPIYNECKNFAEKLKLEGIKGWTIEDSFFTKIFIQNSPIEISYISKIFHKLTGFSILQGINNKLNDDDVKIFLQNFVFAILSPSEYFATKLNKAIIKKNDKNLTRILVSRHDIDMEEIKNYYFQLYGKELNKELKDIYSGLYYKVINKLIGV
jgi:annexin A7/11